MVTIATAPISESDPLVEMTDVAAGQIFKVPQSQAKKLADASGGNLKPGRPIPQKAPVDTTKMNAEQQIAYRRFQNYTSKIVDVEGKIATADAMSGGIDSDESKQLRARRDNLIKLQELAGKTFIARGGDPADLEQIVEQSPGGSQDYDWRDYQ